jgi:hypothetical protein
MRSRIATIIRQRGAGPVVLVNCQSEGGADEGQPGFSLVFATAVLFDQWVQWLGRVWKARAIERDVPHPCESRSGLAFKAPVDAELNTIYGALKLFSTRLPA